MVTDIKKLFCLIEGESMDGAFPINIPCTDSVGDLKRLIKAESSPQFDNIPAKSLQLWRVAIPVTSSTKDVPVTLNEIITPTKLDNPISTLAHVFDQSLDKDVIHIFVVPPQQPKEIEVVLLETGVVLKEYTFFWKVIESIATLNDLWSTIFGSLDYLGPDYKQDTLKMSVVNDMQQSIILDNNEDLRKSLREATTAKNTKISISIEIAPKSFIKWSFRDVCRTLRLSTAAYTNIDPTIDILPPFDDLKSAQLDISQKLVLEKLTDNVSMKTKVLKLKTANEATKSLIVFEILAAATLIFHDDLYLTSQQKLGGPRGQGVVDFAVLSQNDSDQILGVTEVKKEDFNQGYAQNILQLETTVLSKKRRRELDDVDGEEPSKKQKAYGIVTDSEKWAFLECTLHGDGSISYRASQCDEPVIYSNKSEMEKGIKAIFQKVVWLWSQMKNEDQGCRYRGPQSSRTVPSAKRIKSSPL